MQGQTHTTNKQEIMKNYWKGHEVYEDQKRRHIKRILETDNEKTLELQQKLWLFAKGLKQ